MQSESQRLSLTVLMVLLPYYPVNPAIGGQITNESVVVILKSLDFTCTLKVAAS